MYFKYNIKYILSTDMNRTEKVYLDMKAKYKINVHTSQ